MAKRIERNYTEASVIGSSLRLMPIFSTEAKPCNVVYYGLFYENGKWLTVAFIPRLRIIESSPYA